jgi:hypothetical protein
VTVGRFHEASGNAESSVSYQDIQMAYSLSDFGKHSIEAFGFADISPNGYRLPAFGLYFLDHACGIGHTSTVIDHHQHAFTGQAVGNSPAEAPGGAGYQGLFPGQFRVHLAPAVTGGIDCQFFHAFSLPASGPLRANIVGGLSPISLPAVRMIIL